MLYISLKTNYKLTLKQENMINRTTNELCQLFFKDRAQNVMIHIEDDQIMYINGKESPCMMIQLVIDCLLKQQNDLKDALKKMIHEMTRIKYEHINVIIEQKQ